MMGSQGRERVGAGADAYPSGLGWPLTVAGGGGEMGARIRAHDWVATPLGPPDAWPPALTAAVGIMLGAGVPLAVYWGADLTLLYNDAWRALIGDKHPAALGRPARDVFPEIWGAIAPVFARVLAGGGAAEARDQLLPLRRGGRVEDAWFTYSVNPVPGADGAVAGVLNIATETTAQRQAEAALRASEERQAFLLRLSDALRPLADTVAIQATAARVLGEHLGASRVLYGEIVDEAEVVIHRDYTHGVASMAGRYAAAAFGDVTIAAYKRGEPVVIDEVATDPRFAAPERAAFAAAGIAATLSVGLLKGGRWVAAFSVHQVTPRAWTARDRALVAETAERTWAALERGRAETALREAHATLERRVAERTAELAAAVEGLRASEGRLRLLLEQMPVALWTTDRDLRVTALTGALLLALPPPLRAGVGRTLPELDAARGGPLTAADGAASAAGTGPLSVFRRALGGAPGGFDVEEDGRTYAAHVEPLRDAAGQIVGTVGVAHDVTERTLLRLQDEFLALASHELRTPLTPTMGYLEMALATLDEATPARRYVARAVEQVERFSELVGDLLEVGRLRGGKLSLEMGGIDLVTVARRAVDAAEVEAASQGQRIALDAPATPLLVRGNAGRLEQVALNLLTNAVKYAAQSPTIDVRLRADDAGEAVLEVRDYGPGIPAADLPRLFSRFYQVARPDRPSRGGLGLGLYLVKELVEAHGGDVAVASVVGAGTTFTVRLPLLKAGKGEPDAPASTTATTTATTVGG